MAKAKVTNIKSKMKSDFDCVSGGVALKGKSPFTGFISKIRIDAKTDIPDIDFIEHKANGKSKVVFEGAAKALDSFLKSMQDLSEVFCEICELDDKKDDVLITTVNFSEKGGVIISGQVPLNNGVPQPLCINTPHIMIESEKGYSLPDYAVKQLDELKRQAMLYAQGESKKKQMDLGLEVG